MYSSIVIHSFTHFLHSAFAVLQSPFVTAIGAQAGLGDDDVARAVMFAIDQPPGVGINEIVMRHPDQAI